MSISKVCLLRKFPVSVCAWFFGAAVTFGADTAYTALKVVGAEYGNAALQQVVEVNGTEGRWNVVLADGQASSRLREIRVRDGQIKKQRLVSRSEGQMPPFDVNALNLDSDGVFATLTQQTSEPIPHESVNYSLAAGSDGRTPVWTVTAQLGNGRTMALQIAGDTGAILSALTAPPLVAEGPDAAPIRQGAARARRESASRHDGARELVGDVARLVNRPVRVVRRIIPF